MHWNVKPGENPVPVINNGRGVKNENNDQKKNDKFKRKHKTTVIVCATAFRALPF